VEGIHLLQSLLQAGCQPHEIVFCETALENAEVNALLVQMQRDSRYQRIALYQLAKGLGRLFQLVHGVRLACTIAPLALPVRTLGFAVLMDGIQDAGNVGSILRSAAASGCHAAYLRQGCAAAWSPKVLRAAMGAHWQLPIVEGLTLLQIRQLKQQHHLVATSPNARADLFGTTLPSPLLWVFGSEGAGVSPELLVLADLQLAIAQESAVESLNVAASAAICLFESRRQQQLT
jgi:RNA methyltransferase, TrmH family